MLQNALKRTISRIKGENILYFPGCLTNYKYPKIAQNYRSMLMDSGVKFVIIPELSCCGSPLLNAGYSEEFLATKRNNLELLKKHGITKIITNCPYCFKAFKRNYKFDVEHISQTLDKRGYKPSKEGGEATYHEPRVLSEEGVTKEPKALLKRKGYDLIEPSFFKETGDCCGVSNGLKQNHPEVSNKIASRKLKQTKTGIIVVSSPYCYAHLSENIDKDSNKKIIELSEALFDE